MSPSLQTQFIYLFAIGILCKVASADQILRTSGFTNCIDNSSITVDTVDIEYNNGNRTVSFNVVGSSSRSLNVTATLNVTAYGNSVYSNSFDPCDEATFVSQLCPVPVGIFSASGVQAIPSAYASLVPSIAFEIPDIAAQATLQLKAKDDGSNIGCVQSEVSNGKTASVPAVSYAAAGVAGVALLMAGVSAVSAAAAGVGGAGTGGAMNPSFVDIIGVFQGIAMNGMMSVSHPPVYRAFAKNFAFSIGLIPWTGAQSSIDQFRSSTGGNLTEDNVQFLQNATLLFTDGATKSNTSSIIKRIANMFAANLQVRGITTSVNSTELSNSSSSTMSSLQLEVSGISAYVEELSIPQANTFMTVLLIVAIIIAAIVVGILLFKLILEIWTLFATFPKSLIGFRKHYWGTMARSIVQLIFILYGIWTLYCIFQFTHGDSWAAMVLAAVTLSIFTAVLASFTVKILWVARKYKEMDGDARRLYDEKETWVKYSLFYDSYKKKWWWVFIPVIIYSAVKGAVLAASDGHGLAQTVAQLAIEGLMLALLLFTRPFERRSGNIINIFIQVVRVLSVICILVFVEELGIAQTTQTVTGVVLIAVQSALTGTLAILLAVNMLITCFRDNPHRMRRKEAEKLKSVDNLASLGARSNPLYDSSKASTFTTVTSLGNDIREPKVPVEAFPVYGSGRFDRANTQRKMAPTASLLNGSAVHMRDGSRETLVTSAAPFGSQDGGSTDRKPTVPTAIIGIEGYGGYRGVAY